jgi:hypothetical protein
LRSSVALVTPAPPIGGRSRIVLALETSATSGLELQRADKLERRKALTAEGVIYDELRTACGVRGVPETVIEVAILEIESEASRVLAEKYILRQYRPDTEIV